MSNPRDALKTARRVVVKVGSRLLATYPNLITDLAQQLADSSARPTRQILLVSSGAVSLGTRALGYAKRPTQIAKLQAAAAVGQVELMKRYAEAFAAHGKSVAQVLITHSDLASRRRMTNAQQAISALFDAGAIPIVNENDTVSTEEIAFGDNDQMASHVVPLVQADLLLLLTDVEGVLAPDKSRIAVMDHTSVMAQLKNDDTHGTGGMQSKVSAAFKASHSGAAVVIGSGVESDSVLRILNGEDVGTLFLPHVSALRARQHWIAYTLKPRGVILINDGAARALRENGRSLLPVGVVGVSGRFSRGDAVRLVTTDGNEVGRGLSRLGVLEVARMAGRPSEELATVVGSLDTVVVHRDDMVVSG
jgi:glutamate 5-kinase